MINESCEDWDEPSWTTESGDLYITFNQIMKLVDDKVISMEVSKLSNLVTIKTPSKTRVMKSNLEYPIIVATYNNDPRMIVDGCHRLIKSQMLKKKYVNVKVLNLNQNPTLMPLFY